MNIRFICGLKMQNHKTEKPFGSPPLLWTGWGHVVPAPFLQFSRHSKKSCWISALESPLCIEIRLPCIHWNVGFAYGWVKGFVCGLCFVCGVIKSQLFFPCVTHSCACCSGWVSPGTPGSHCGYLGVRWVHLMEDFPPVWSSDVRRREDTWFCWPLQRCWGGLSSCESCLPREKGVTCGSIFFYNIIIKKLILAFTG